MRGSHLNMLLLAALAVLSLVAVYAYDFLQARRSLRSDDTPKAGRPTGTVGREMTGDPTITSKG